MKIFILERARSIAENKKLLEKKLNVKLSVTGRKVSIEGNEIDEFVASRVLEALNLGFDTETALTLSEPDCILEKIEIKNFTKRRNLAEVRARLIGKSGKTKELVEELSNCRVSVHGNEIGIIGDAEKIKTCIQALIKIIQGSKQSSVYAYLEKSRRIIHPSDLGLKIDE